MQRKPPPEIGQPFGNDHQILRGGSLSSAQVSSLTKKSDQLELASQLTLWINEYGLTNFYIAEVTINGVIIRERTRLKNSTEVQQNNIVSIFNKMIEKKLVGEYIAFFRDNPASWGVYHAPSNEEVFKLFSPMLKKANFALYSLIEEGELGESVSIRGSEESFNLYQLLRSFPDREGRIEHPITKQRVTLEEIMQNLVPPLPSTNPYFDNSVVKHSEISLDQKIDAHLTILESGTPEMRELSTKTRALITHEKSQTQSFKENLITCLEATTKAFNNEQSPQQAKEIIAGEVKKNPLLLPLKESFFNGLRSIANFFIKAKEKLTALKSSVKSNTLLSAQTFRSSPVISTPRNHQPTGQHNNFGYYETIGKRNEQEDALAWSQLSPAHLKDLTPDEIGDCLKNSFLALDAEIKTPTEGSTASTTIYDGNGNLISGTLGDAVTFAMVFDEDGTVLGTTRLNSIIHKPEDPAEKRRLNQAFLPHYIKMNPAVNVEDVIKKGQFPHVVKAGRVNGDCLIALGEAPALSPAISRAIGDHQVRKLGVCADATIDITNINQLPGYADAIAKGKKPIVRTLTACDGLTDGAKNKVIHEKCLAHIRSQGEDPAKMSSDVLKRKVHAVYIQICLEEIKAEGLNPAKMSEQALSQKFAEFAIRHGSTDNISVAVQTIPTNSKQPTIISVFDGHGGDAVSTYAAQHMVATLEKELRHKPRAESKEATHLHYG